MKENTKVVIGTLLIVAVGFLLWRTFRSPTVPELAPDEAIPEGEDAGGVRKWEGEVIFDPNDVIIRPAD